jgi:hypothetical protein
MDDKNVEQMLRAAEREVAEVCDTLLAQLKELEDLLLQLKR